MNASCDDCATCTSRPELARGLGRNPDEVQRLAVRCPNCGHRLSRHQHGPARSALGDLEAAGVTLESGPPPRDSRLGKLLAELGEYPEGDG